MRKLLLITILIIFISSCTVQEQEELKELVKETSQAYKESTDVIDNTPNELKEEAEQFNQPPKEETSQEMIDVKEKQTSQSSVINEELKEEIPKKNIYCEKIAWFDCYGWAYDIRKEYWPEMTWCIQNSVYDPLYSFRRDCYTTLAVINNDISFCKNFFTYGIEANLNYNADEYEKYEEECIVLVSGDIEYCKKTYNEDEWRESWKAGIKAKRESCIKNIEDKEIVYDIESFSEFEGKTEEECLKILTNDRNPRAVFRDETNKKGYRCMISLALNTESDFEYKKLPIDFDVSEPLITKKSASNQRFEISLLAINEFEGKLIFLFKIKNIKEQFLQGVGEHDKISIGSVDGELYLTSVSQYPSIIESSLLANGENYQNFYFVENGDFKGYDKFSLTYSPNNWAMSGNVQFYIKKTNGNYEAISKAEYLGLKKDPDVPEMDYLLTDQLSKETDVRVCTQNFIDDELESCLYTLAKEKNDQSVCEKANNQDITSGCKKRFEAVA